MRRGIEIPGTIVTSASRSMIMPKERLRRRSISQANVKCSGGASSCSRCSTTEVRMNTLEVIVAFGFSFKLVVLTPSIDPAGVFADGVYS